MSADLGGEASAGIKEIAAGVDPRGMSTDQLAGGGRGGAPRPGWPQVRWQPAGIRNGGLLLVLVAAAALMALVDQPVGPDQGRRLPGGVQHLPPPVGIAALVWRRRR